VKAGSVAAGGRSPLLFVLLVFALSVPFWLLGATRQLGMPVPSPQLSLTTAVILLGLFFVSAIGEESGWSGYPTRASP
jgi:membrane protease YdiL (CAAX protease family)